ncbi:uncharacterized protein LOC130741246 [Lotus japonicus]|uniref:uncharacterized protein LOC130741246 n=1 Tax=Lotus japonicus TaxID=34305 RepID=UPI00258C44E0|nr:uncharacterized protein LOC130741246 [Lotus japonicus]
MGLEVGQVKIDLALRNERIPEFEAMMKEQEKKTQQELAAKDEALAAKDQELSSLRAEIELAFCNGSSSFMVSSVDKVADLNASIKEGYFQVFDNSVRNKSFYTKGLSIDSEFEDMSCAYTALSAVVKKNVCEAFVEKGMQNGKKIPSSGDADEASETIAGDIIFVVPLVEHSKFKRKAEDLFIEHALSLTQALCGFQFLLTHLDGRQFLIKSNP